MTDDSPTPIASTKTCKVCSVDKPLGEFAVNPKARDGRNSVCADCYGRSTVTQRGKRRAAEDRQRDTDLELIVDKVFDEMFKRGDPVRDFFTKHVLRLMLTARNEQTQLTAMKMLAETMGIDKETPSSERDLIHTAFMRMKQQLPQDTTK